MNDSCENCWWYWTSAGGYDCNHFPKPRNHNPMSTDPCGYWEPKAEKKEVDDWEQFQEEWN